MLVQSYSVNDKTLEGENFFSFWVTHESVLIFIKFINIWILLQEEGTSSCACICLMLEQSHVMNFVFISLKVVIRCIKVVVMLCLYE